MWKPILLRLSTMKNSITKTTLGNLRSYSAINGNASSEMKCTDMEQKLSGILRKRFPTAREVQVVDISGGCGAMFHVTVISPEFKEMSPVKQHRMVNDALKDEVKQMHGLRISTCDE